MVGIEFFEQKYHMQIFMIFLLFLRTASLCNEAKTGISDSPF